jgi:hypothetical protein
VFAIATLVSALLVTLRTVNLWKRYAAWTAVLVALFWSYNWVFFADAL